MGCVSTNPGRFPGGNFLQRKIPRKIFLTILSINVSRNFQETSQKLFYFVKQLVIVPPGLVMKLHPEKLQFCGCKQSSIQQTLESSPGKFSLVKNLTENISSTFCLIPIINFFPSGKPFQKL